MSAQAALFHDSIYDALAADVAAIGGVKKAGAMLWPANSDAGGRLRACLSTEHAQKLDLEELVSLIRLARDVGSTATANYLAQQLGFELKWIKPEDAIAQLQREFIETIKRAEQIAKRLKP